jgi:hypothetical protein
VPVRGITAEGTYTDQAGYRFEGGLTGSGYPDGRPAVRIPPSRLSIDGRPEADRS